MRHDRIKNVSTITFPTLRWRWLAFGDPHGWSKFIFWIKFIDSCFVSGNNVPKCSKMFRSQTFSLWNEIVWVRLLSVPLRTGVGFIENPAFEHCGRHVRFCVGIPFWWGACYEYQSRSLDCRIKSFSWQQAHFQGTPPRLDDPDRWSSSRLSRICWKLKKMQLHRVASDL